MHLMIVDSRFAAGLLGSVSSLSVARHSGPGLSQRLRPQACASQHGRRQLMRCRKAREPQHLAQPPGGAPGKAVFIISS